MPKIPDHETLLREWLAINGFDGLYLSGGDCACTLVNLAPCAFVSRDCRAGYYHEWHPGCEKGCELECARNWGGWCIREERDETADE